MPADALAAKARSPRRRNPFMRAGQIRLADLMPSQDLLTDPRAQSALLGLVEVRRNRAVVLRLHGPAEEADDAADVGHRPGARQRPGAAARECAAVSHQRR